MVSPSKSELLVSMHSKEEGQKPVRIPSSQPVRRRLRTVEERDPWKMGEDPGIGGQRKLLRSR